MINLIRADWYRAIHGKAFRLCMLLTLGWVFLCAYMQHATIALRENLSGGEITIDYIHSFFNYNPITLPLIIFCSSFVANDFRQKTVKHYMEKGIDRWKYFVSKMVIGWLAAVIFLACAFAMGFFCYKMYFDTGSAVEISVQNILIFVICQMLCHMSVATFAVFVTGMIRNSSASMAVNFIFMFFGYLGLSGLMKMISFDFDISLLWAYSTVGMTSIGVGMPWTIWVILVFLGYFIVFNGILMVIYKKKDIA